MRRPYPAAVRRVPSLGLALVLLLTAMIVPLVPATADPAGTIADDFQSGDFNGSTGSLSWTGPWTENGESDGAGAGQIQVVNEGRCADDVCLLLGKASGPDVSVDRQADLSLAATATLSFEYEAHQHGGGAGHAYLAISDDNGTSWSPLDSWPLGTNNGPSTALFDISPYLATDTHIRFSVIGSADDSHLNVDNLVITADDSWYLKGGSVPSSSLGIAPDQTTLPNHDPARDTHPGLVLDKSEVGLTETDPKAHQWWLTPARVQTLDGPASLTLWSAMRDFRTGERGVVDAGLYDCLADGSDCDLLATGQLDIADWSGGTADWVEHELDFGTVDTTISDGRALAVKIVPGNSSNSIMWFAYDTVAYPSRLNVTLAAPAPPDPGVIVISEFSHRNDDFIELYNAGSSSVDIDDFVLRLDGPGTSHITITQGGAPIVLPPGGHYLLAEASSGLAGAADQTFGFGLPSNLGIRLRDASSTLLDAVGIGTSTWFESNALPSMPAGTTQSYERLNGSTLGSCIDTDDNRSDFVHVWGYATPESTGDPAVPCGSPTATDHVVISEFRPEGPAGQNDEFIELLNPTATPVDISAWVLHITEPGLFRDYHVVPGGTVLDPDEHYLLSNIDGPTPNDAQPYDIPTSYVSAWGDVVLKDNIGTVVDVLGYGPTSNGQMYESVALPAYDGGSGDRSFTRRDGGYTDTDKNIYDFTYSFDATPTAGNPGPNRAPVFDQDLGDRTDAEGDLIDIDAPATDPDSGDNLTYSSSGLPEGVSIDSDTGTISGALSPNASGTHSVTLTVSDDGTPSLEDTDVFTWTVLGGEVTYLIANTGGTNGGDDLLTAVDRSNWNPATNEIDIGTGTGTTGIEAATLQPGTNVLYAVDGDQLGTVDLTTGVFTPRAAIAGVGNGPQGLIALNNIEGLSFDPFSGELYATHRRGNFQEDLLFRFDPASGAHIPGAFGGDDYVAVQSQGPYYHAASIAHDPTDGQLYAIHWDIGGDWSIATVDPVTGATTTQGNVSDDLMGLAFTGSGDLHASTAGSAFETLQHINKTTGQWIGGVFIDNGREYEAVAISFPADPNLAPVFDQNLPDRTDTEGSAISLSAAATDPDASGDLTYSAVGLPPGLAIDTSSGLISGTIGYVGTGNYNTEITVTDDGIPNLSALDAFTWTISELNQPPAFDQDLPDRSDAEGAAISIFASASDPDVGDTLTYGATGLPPGISIDTGSGLISGTIDFAAAATSPYAVTITASDDGAPSASAIPDTFTWTVTDTNQPPSVVNPGAQTTPELTPFTLGLTASDPDGTTPSFNDGGTLPAWATLTDNGDGTATIAGTPGGGASGTATVTITVSDGGVPDLTATAVFDLTVTNTNLPPTIVTPGNQTIGEGSPLTIPLTGADPDGTTVSFTDSGTLPAWATLTDNGDNTATITGTPGYGDATTTSVTITVTDGSLTDDAAFDIIVTNTNRSPSADPIADQSVAESFPLTLLVTGSDPDGPSPSLTAPGLPGWATITDHGDGTATIAGTPGYDDAGTTTVTVNAFDGSLFDTATFDLTVTNTNRAPIANAVVDASVAEGSALVPIVVTATDPDGTLPSLAATGLPGWAAFVDNGDGTATITGTPGYSDAATTTITVNVEDGGVPNLADSTSFDLTVTNTNRPPVVDTIADQTVAESNPFTLTVTASDPDGTIPSLTAAGLPGWASLVDNGDGTATLTGTPGPGDAATSTITVTASDGSLTNDAEFDLTVTDVNRPPIFDTDLPDRGDAEGAVISLLAAATDPDLDNITYAAAGLPPGLAIDLGTGLISGTVATIAEAGSPYAVTLTATDSGTPSITATDTFTWTITNTNQSPVFSQELADRADAEGAVISLSAGATDPDLDVLTYSATGLPPGLAISTTTGVVSGTISLSSVGSYGVTITVTDSGFPVLTATDTFTWVVTNTNQPPLLASIGDQLGPEETEITFTATATDPDGDGVEFSLAGAPAGAAIDAATGTFAWTPAEVDGVGSHTVTVIATDDGSPQLTDSQIVTITVTEANRPPTIETIADQTSNEGSSVSLAVVASDPDLPTNHLSFSASGLPPGLSINGSNGLISGTVAADTVGVYAVTIAVTDNAEPPYLATTTFEWKITDTNKAPTLGRISDQFGDEQATISFTATATDADGDNLTYSLASAPSGARIGANSGVFTWTPGELDGPGTFSAVVLVTDDGTPTLGDTQVVSITVAEANLPPTIDAIADQHGIEGDEVEVTIGVTDPDLPANELTLSATGLPPGLFLNPATGAIGGTLQASDEALFTVELTVTDHGIPQLSATTSFVWTVSPGPDEPDPAVPPTISEIGNQYTDEGSTVNLAVPATSTGTLSYTVTGLPPGLTINPRTGSITGTVGTDAIGTHTVVVTVTDDATPAQLAHSAFNWTVTDVAAADDKEDLVQALDDFAAEIVETTGVAADQEPVRRSLVVMGSAAAATTESLRWPFALLAALLVGFATVGRVGLYPLLWRGDRQTGTMTLYDPELLFGLIEPDEGGEAVHVHANAFPRRMRPLLRIGMRVRYRVLASDNRSSAWGATADE